MKSRILAPDDLSRVLEYEVLPLVSKPNRYVGNELGLAGKDWDAADVRFLLCYPDAYEVGMSHTGTQILYHVVNREDHFLLDRVYAPWPDMEEQLRARGIPLWGLEHRRPVQDYDVLGFTLQSELTYTNLLNVLDLSHLPVHQADRREDDPLVCIGGPCASNPEPLAPFVDFALIGDAEDAIGEVLDLVREWKRERGETGETRAAFLARLAVEVPGVYVPSLYEVRGNNRLARPVDSAPDNLPWPVVARKVPVLRDEDHPRDMVISLTETTHDRLPIEVMRGCMRGCRFCQAGYLYRPARERDVDETLEIAERGIKTSGWQEVSLLSLSTADYSQALELTDRISRTMVEKGVGVSLPSLRADAFSVGLAENVSRVRKSGFTFAPEAGSQRLRDVINKGITEDDILSAVERSMESGWTSVKLYFMIGHPTENTEDFEELAQLVEKIKAILAKYPGRRHITLGFSPFVPKSHTPFQWEKQDTYEETRRKLAWVKQRLKGRGVEIRHHETADTAIEGIISRGGREIAGVIEDAWRAGARFDGWGEHCRFECWESALEAHGLTLEDTFREIGEEEDNPWEIVSYKIDRGYFLKERHKAYEAAETDECKHERCSACGVCDFDAMKNLLAEPVETPAPARARPLLQAVDSTRVRLRYAKGGALRFISHLDLQRELERAYRRAELPIVYSEGFSPRPKVSAGPPLSLGWTSDAEWIDLELAGQWDRQRLTELLNALNTACAPGISFQSAAVMPGKVDSLMAAIERSRYVAVFPPSVFNTSLGELQRAVHTFMEQDSFVIERKRKRRTTTVDLRPMVYEFTVLGEDQVMMDISTSSAGSVKPTEILEATFSPGEQLPLIRIHKLAAVLDTGEDPDAGAPVAVQVGSSEKGHIDHVIQPAGNPRSDSGGRQTC